MRKPVVVIGLCLLAAAAWGAEPVPAAAPTPAPAAAPPAEAPAPSKAMDRLELEQTTITGNRELPKVMYVVPWKKADLGDLNGRPANSLLDEVLAPVDRDVFKREVAYFGALTKDSTPQPPQAAAPEK
jgi:hypothetical protein